MSDNKPDKKLILDYVESLLYFYGVMDFESLYRVAAGFFGEDLDRQYIKNALDLELDRCV